MATAQEKQLTILQQQFKGIKNYVTERQDTLAKLLPPNMPVEQLIHTALSCINRNPNLLECTPASWQQSLIDAAQLGLLPSSVSQYGHLIPYRDKGVMTCHFQTGYRGRIKLARDSGQVNNIYAHVVHEKDEFQLIYGSEESIFHKPYLRGNPGPLLLVYAVAELTNGSKLIEFLTKEQIDWIKTSAKASSGPWFDSEFSYEEMARKSVINRIYKYLPSSPQMDKAVAIDNEGHTFTEEEAISVDFSQVMAEDGPVHSQEQAVKGQMQAKKMKFAAKDEQPGQKVEDAIMGTSRLQLVLDAATSVHLAASDLTAFIIGEWGVSMETIPADRFEELMELIQTGGIQRWLSLGQPAEA